MSASERAVRLIDSEEGARRLSRVILSDIELYNKERIRVGASLASEIEEGRRLFRSRVAPDLFPLFETVLADKKFGGGGAASPVAAAPAAPAARPVEQRPEPVAAPAARPVEQRPEPVAAAPA